MKKLLEAIKVAHEGRNHPLNVKHHGYYHTWDAQADDGWQNYSRARCFISRHKFIEKVLVWVRYI